MEEQQQCPKLRAQKRIFIPDDSAKEGMNDGCATPSPSSAKKTKISSPVVRSRDLPRRVLLPELSASRKRPAAVQAPVTPARKRKHKHKQHGGENSSSSRLPRVDEEEAALPENPSSSPADDAAPTAAAAAAPESVAPEEQQEAGNRDDAAQVEPFFELETRMTVVSVEQEVSAAEIPSSPRTPPRISVANLPATPQAPQKRERTAAERHFPSSASQSIRRLHFNDVL